MKAKMKFKPWQIAERKIFKLAKKIQRLTRGNHFDVVCYSDGEIWIKSYGFDTKTPDECLNLHEFYTNVWLSDIK